MLLLWVRKIFSGKHILIIFIAKIWNVHSYYATDLEGANNGMQFYDTKQKMYWSAVLRLPKRAELSIDLFNLYHALK